MSGGLASHNRRRLSVAPGLSDPANSAEFGDWIGVADVIVSKNFVPAPALAPVSTPGVAWRSARSHRLRDHRLRNHWRPCQILTARGRRSEPRSPSPGRGRPREGACIDAAMLDIGAAFLERAVTIPSSAAPRNRAALTPTVPSAPFADRTTGGCRHISTDAIWPRCGNRQAGTRRRPSSRLCAQAGAGDGGGHHAPLSRSGRDSTAERRGGGCADVGSRTG
jgi:hypothetical protein